MKQVIVGVLLLSSALLLADDIYLGQPGYAGTGCKPGSVSATLSPDSKELSILFSEYEVEVDGKNRTGRKTCNVAIPVHVPQGLSVSILQIDYRGYNSLPRGANAQLSAEYFFAGAQGPKVVRDFNGVLDDEYTVTDKLLASAIVWSACGADVNLRANTAMRVKTGFQGGQALSTVDSIDVAAGILYRLQWRKC
jgi:hypothetical protein